MAKSLGQNEADIAVNEHEGSVLGLLARIQPATRYQLFKAFSKSPTTSYNASKGSLYPLVTRMIHRGFIQSQVGTSRRQSEVLNLTPLGYRALTGWIVDTGPEHSFTHDPLLLRVMSLRDVPRDERIRWIADAKGLLLEKKQELNVHLKSESSPYAEIVHGTAVAIIDAKLEWLDRLLIQVVHEDVGRNKPNRPSRSRS